MRKQRALTIPFARTVATVAALSLHSTHVRAREIPQVGLLRTPQDGFQPQTVLDRDGALHMIYFKLDASARDIEHPRRAAHRKNVSLPLRVNSEPKKAVAVCTVRRPRRA